MQLPAKLQTGLVEARFVLEILDGPDPDSEPEVIPAEGEVLLEANVPYWPAGAAEMVIIKTEKIVPLRDGFMCTPLADGSPGQEGVRLFATDDSDYGVTGWKWTATPRLKTSSGVKLLDRVKPIEFSVPSNGKVNLSRLLNAPNTPPVGIVQSESNAAAAATFAQDAAQSAERAVQVAAALHDRADQGEFKGDTGPGYTIPALQLTGKDDTPVVTFAPIDIWSGPPTIEGSAGWFREKRMEAGERAPGQQQGDGKPLDIDGSSYFRYPALLAASDWANNSGRIAISNIKPGGDAQYAYELFNLEFVTNSDVVEIMVNVGTTGGTIGTVLVDGKRISERDIRHNGVQGDGMGIKLTFPTAKQRTIRIYGLNNGTGRFGGVAVGAGYTISKPTVRPARKFAFIGDSFVNGTNQVAATETFVWRLADLMGADEVLQMGIGGTGFGSGDAATRFDNRVAAVLAYNPDVIVFAGGRNDSAGAALQKAVSDTLALTGRDKEVYLISTASDASQSAVNDALAAGAKERGVPFIRADVDAFPREDAVHLTHAGHQLFADDLFSKIVSFKPLPELDDALIASQIKSGEQTASALTKAIEFAETVVSKVSKGELIVNVLDYGARRDGNTDDSAAFYAAFAAGVAVYAPAGVYHTEAGIIMPAYKALYGEWARSYTGNATAGARIVIKNPATAGAVLTAGRGCKISAIALQGAGKNNSPQHDGLRLANQTIITEITVSNAKHGINAAYSNGAVITKCQIHDNAGNGINDPLDTIISHNTINTNIGSGIYGGTGANDCSITHNKVEWNDGSGLNFFECHNLNVTTNIVDRNGKRGLSVVGCRESTFGPNVVRRNGRLSESTPNDDVNVYTQGNSGVVFFAQQTSTGGDDANTGGGGYVSPATAFFEQDNTNCAFIGNNYGGGVKSARKVIGTTAGNTYLGNLNFPGVQFAAAQTVRINKFAKANIASGESLSESFRLSEIGTYNQGSVYELIVSCRTGSGVKYSAALNFQVSREGGAASASLPVVTTINGAESAIGTAGTAVATKIAPNEDASFLTVTLTNNTAGLATLQMSLRER